MWEKEKGEKHKIRKGKKKKRALGWLLPSVLFSHKGEAKKEKANKNLSPLFPSRISTSHLLLVLFLFLFLL